jgi:NAD(P)H-hydrate epimerase
MSGSISLSGMAALRSGSGLVTVAVPSHCLETVASFDPCLMTLPLADTGAGIFAEEASQQLQRQLLGVNALGCGPGMRTEKGSQAIVESLLSKTSIPRVFDADALNVMGRLEGGKGSTAMILTPHPGELQRLTGVAAHDRRAQTEAAKELALRSGSIVILKGGPTLVTDGELLWTNSTGNPGMATAGSGDVLTGVLVSLLGQGYSVWEAARLGVYAHGLAGDLAARGLGVIGMTAADIMRRLPQAFEQLRVEAIELRETDIESSK